MTTKRVSVGITRFDVEERRLKGFMVRVFRGGHRISEFFSDARCGGKRKARKAAEERYAELLEEVGPSHANARGKLTSRNSSGLVGVQIAYRADKRCPSHESWSYRAQWIDIDGVRRSNSFTWNKYGEQKAWELASIAREHEITDKEQVLELHELLYGPKRRSRDKKPR